MKDLDTGKLGLRMSPKFITLLYLVSTAAGLLFCFLACIVVDYFTL